MVLDKILGSLIETLPYAILCYLPFQNSLTVSRRRFGFYLAALMVLIPILSLLYIYSPLNKKELWAIGIIVILIFCFVFYCRTVKASVTKLLYVFIVVMSYAFYVVGISRYIEARISYATVSTLYSWVSVAINFVVLAVSLPFVVWLLNRHVRLVIEMEDSPAWKYLWTLPLIFPTITIVYSDPFQPEAMSGWRYITVYVLLMFGSFFMNYMIMKMLSQLDQNAKLTELTTELSEQKKVRDMLFQNITHDLRTHVTVIRSAADILSEGELPEYESQVAHRIARRVAQLEKMIEDLLELSRIESGSLRFKAEPVDITELIQTIYEDYKSTCEKQGVCLTVAPIHGVICADRNRIIQIFDNLIHNALSHTISGCISISAEKHGGGYLFSVKDTGEGIPEKDLPYIFDRFFRSKENQKSGSGLGLAICKSIIEHMGGVIWAESKPGEGTVLHFSLETGKAR